MTFENKNVERTLKVGKTEYPIAERTISLVKEISSVKCSKYPLPEVNALADEYTVCGKIIGEKNVKEILGEFNDNLSIDKLNNLFNTLMQAYKA